MPSGPGIDSENRFLNRLAPGGMRAIVLSGPGGLAPVTRKEFGLAPEFTRTFALRLTGDSAAEDREDQRGRHAVV